MSFGPKEVAHIAKLARIRLSEEEKVRFAAELGKILHFVEQLGEVDTGGSEGVASVVEHPLPWREDLVTDGGRHEAILANAPKREYDCFVVPKVIAQE